MLDKIKNYGLAILGFLTAVLAALFLFEKKKANSSEAKATNAETAGRVDEINRQITDLEKKTKDKENEPVTKDDLLKFLNKPNNNK